MNCSARNNSDSLFDLTGKRELELLEELMIFFQLNIIIKIIPVSKHNELEAFM